MLSLTRKIGERLFLGRIATIQVKEIRGSFVKLIIQAPRSIAVLREEMVDAEGMGYQGEQTEQPTAPVLRPIETAPKDGTYIILFGDSGYIDTPMRCEVCRWDPEYRPHRPWQTYSNNAFEESGGPPTHWMPLPRSS